MGKTSPERDRRLVLSATLGVTFVCGLGAILYLVLSTPLGQPGPPLYPEPPLYAGATGVEIIKGDALQPAPTLVRERVIHFKTGDTAQAVLSFYEDTLTKAGWSLFAKISANELNFYWTDGSIATGLYKTNITTMPSGKGGTDVTLETGTDTGGGDR